MSTPSRSKQQPAPVDPRRTTRHCINGLHDRCPGRVTVFTSSGRQKYEPCACAVPGCNHGPRPRRRR